MSRQPLQRPSVPPGYRPPSSSGQQGGAGFYATAGQQATQPAATRGASYGAGRAPPGFASRADPNDFPALGSTPSAPSSTYASLTTPSSASQPIYSQSSLAQPPPGIAPPAPPAAGQANGAGPGGAAEDSLRGEDFPALGARGQAAAAAAARGEDKDRQDQQMDAYLRQKLQSPSSLPNGAATHSSATPSTGPQGPGSIAGGNAPSTVDSSWAATRTPPPGAPLRASEPVTRPVQQILQSPVDRWGLKALLYELRTHMNTTDRGTMLFGSDLGELGLNIDQREPLYTKFTTPWADSATLSHPSTRIEEEWRTPSVYLVNPPPIQSKIQSLQVDSLFYAFYANPRDVLQLEVAEELWNRGWRYHTKLGVWLEGHSLRSLGPDQLGPDSSDQPRYLPGPFIVFDPSNWARTQLPDDFPVDATLLEVTRPAAALVAEEKARKEVKAQQQQQAQAQGPNGGTAFGAQQAQAVAAR